MVHYLSQAWTGHVLKFWITTNRWDFPQLPSHSMPVTETATTLKLLNLHESLECRKSLETPCVIPCQRKFVFFSKGARWYLQSGMGSHRGSRCFWMVFDAFWASKCSLQTCLGLIISFLWGQIWALHSSAILFIFSWLHVQVAANLSHLTYIPATWDADT